MSDSATPCPFLESELGGRVARAAHAENDRGETDTREHVTLNCWAAGYPRGRVGGGPGNRGDLGGATAGLTKHPLYHVWRAMIDRCENPNVPWFRHYGALGVTVWGPWHDSARFFADIEAGIGPRPPGRTPGGLALWSIDRFPDPAGDYVPWNIRWATWLQQARNKRSTAVTVRVKNS
jgi:hypothetical protein